jgi:serralysin
MAGGLGNDTYSVDTFTDLITEAAAAGTDLVQSSASIYTLAAEVENLTLVGNNNAVGTGNALGNVMVGANTNNQFLGKNGNDTLTGSAGLDSFVFDTAPNATTNKDTITDFVHGTDKILLDEAVYGEVIDGGIFNDGGLIVTQGAAAVGAHAQFIYTQSTGALYYDANGSAAGGQVQVAVLTSKPVLDATDFQVYS